MLSGIAFFGLITVPLLVIILLAILVFEVAMFISAIQNKHITSNARIFWIIGMLLIHPFIAIAYYFTDYKRQG